MRWLLIACVCLLAGWAYSQIQALEDRVARLEAQLQAVRGKVEIADTQAGALQSALESLQDALENLGAAASPQASQAVATAYSNLATAAESLDAALQDALALLQEEDEPAGKLLKTGVPAGMRKISVQHGRAGCGHRRGEGVTLNGPV